MMPCEWQRRCKEIANIIEAVDDRAMAGDGPVSPTMQEMTQTEMSRIYALASGNNKSTTRGRNCGRPDR